MRRSVSVSERASDRTSRTPKAFRLYGAALTTLALVTGTTAFVGTAQAAPAAAVDGTASPSDAAVNRSLDSMAKLFAGAVTDEQVRREIHDGAAQRFDGDTNVLWKTLAQEPGVRGALAATHSRTHAAARLADSGSAVDRLAAGIPRFQVAVPENLGAWDPASYTPLVAYVPQGVDDTTLETITAYDASGKAYQLDAQVAPSRPVIVLGVNERTDDSGKVLRDQQDPQAQTQEAAEFSTLASSYEVRMTKMHVIDDKEPWARGDAEISIRAKSNGCSGTAYTDHNWASLNDNDDWWIGPRYLGNTRCAVIFYAWEDDGSNWDFTLSYKGVSLNVKMDSGDDRIGGQQLSHSSFSGGSDFKGGWSALSYWAD